MTLLLLPLFTALTLHASCGVTHHSIGWEPGTAYRVTVKATGELVAVRVSDVTGSFEYVAPDVEAGALRIRRVER